MGDVAGRALSLEGARVVSLRSVCGCCTSFDRVQDGRVPVGVVGWESFEFRSSFSLKTRGEPWNLIWKKKTGIQSSKKPFSADACSCCMAEGLAVPRAEVSAGVTSAAVCRVPASVNVQPR